MEWNGINKLSLCLNIVTYNLFKLNAVIFISENSQMCNANAIYR